MYYPKSQIIENLYANPGELFDPSTGEEYIGPYFQTSDNEFFTGKNPQDLPNNLITPNAPTEKSIDSEPLPESYYIINDAYYASKGRNINTKSPQPPKSSNSLPTKANYQLGEFQRYFLLKNNENTYIEVNNKEYQLFKSKNNMVQWDYYYPISINWNLTGKLEDVFNTNRNIVDLVEYRNRIFGFVNYFKGKFSQYYLDNKK